jgi:DNA replication protein DnaC
MSSRVCFSLEGLQAQVYWKEDIKLYSKKDSTIITTNTPFSDWQEIFGTPMLAQAILDRLLYHSHVISIKGESYRLKEKLDFFSNVSNS